MSKTSLCTLIVVIFAFNLHPTFAADDVVPDEKDPCANLVVGESSLAKAESENLKSEQIDLLDDKLRRFDECLDKLGISADALSGTDAANASSGDSAESNVPFESQTNPNPNTNESATSAENATQELERDLREFDENLFQADAALTADIEQSKSQAAVSRTHDATSTVESDESSEDKLTTANVEQDADKLQAKIRPEETQAKHTEQTERTPDLAREDGVLKLIREAAEKETDPNTRQALWDQYYEYLDNKSR